MKKGWLTFNSILLGLSLVISFILIIIFINCGILDMFGSDAKTFVVVVAILVVLSYNAIWGLLVEMANNIAKTGEQHMQINMMPHGQPMGQSVNTEQARGNVQPSGGVWKCGCGMENTGEAVFCQNCGARRS